MTASQMIVYTTIVYLVIQACMVNANTILMRLLFKAIPILFALALVVTVTK